VSALPHRWDGSPDLFQYESSQAVHEEYDGPFAAPPTLHLQRSHECDTMSDNAALVGWAFEELRYMRIVSVRQNTSVGIVLGQKLAWPEDRRYRVVSLLIENWALLLATKNLR
jgi:hypothetical protein